MPKESESGEERTEQPTAKRLEDSRREGQVAKSTDFSQLANILAAFIAIRFFAPTIWQNLADVTRNCLSTSFSYSAWTVNDMRHGFVSIFKYIAPEILLIMSLAAFCGVLATAVQTKFLWSSKLLVPKFSKLNPLNGFKRIFSANNVVNLVKNITKLALILPIAYSSMRDLLPGIAQLPNMPIAEFFPFVSFAIFTILKKVLILLVIIAILDYGWNFYKNARDIKMTKTEVKEEHKSTEGDEATKRRIRAIGMRRIREKMMKELATADVVVTNPTHYAVAIKYVADSGFAPRVVAKGKDHLAEIIKKKAIAYGIPVIERKPLARALFAAVEIGKEIPYELYKAVAELLAYVYRIKGKNPLAGRKKKK